MCIAEGGSAEGGFAEGGIAKGGIAMGSINVREALLRPALARAASLRASTLVALNSMHGQCHPVARPASHTYTVKIMLPQQMLHACALVTHLHEWQPCTGEGMRAWRTYR